MVHRTTRNAPYIQESGFDSRIVTDFPEWLIMLINLTPDDWNI